MRAERAPTSSYKPTTRTRTHVSARALGLTHMPLTESVWNESSRRINSEKQDSSSSYIMRGEEASGTVLHRLIQEQLRYGNPTDAHTLLAIQQQALQRGGGGSGSGGVSSQTSSESLSLEEPQSPQLSARQEPQGQEHHIDYQHPENYRTIPYRNEELPTYEQAKAQSKYMTSKWCQSHRGCSLEDDVISQKACEEENSWELMQGHARSLSDCLLKPPREHGDKIALMCSASYPQINEYNSYQHLQHTQQEMEYNKQDPYTECLLPAWIRPAMDYQQFYKPPPPFNSHHNRNIPTMQTPDVFQRLSTAPPAGREVSSFSPSQMEKLINENKKLRQELEGHTEKAIKIQKLEQEIQRISEAYDNLMKGCAKRETLEQVLRNKLMDEVKRLELSNVTRETEAADQNQHVIAKIVQQNEEQRLKCERLEQEVLNLKNEAEKQQCRSKALEKTLRSAQTRSQQLWTELQKKRAYVEKVERLQGALAQLQAACEKREGLEMRLRTRLEEELRNLRSQQKQTQPASGTSHENLSTLQVLLREKEEHILSLEADKTRWEQKYLEEKTMREFAMDVAATAAAQRDTTIINHSPCHSCNSSFTEELPSSEHISHEVENRIRALHAQILEKDTVITILKQRLRRESRGPTKASSDTQLHSSVTHSTQGKSHSEDKTTSLTHFSLITGNPGEDLSNKPTTDQPSRADSKSNADIFRGLDDVDAEAVEIFI